MKKHLGLSNPATYPKTQAATQQVLVYSQEAPKSDAFETDLLRKQAAEVQA